MYNEKQRDALQEFVFGIGVRMGAVVHEGFVVAIAVIGLVWAIVAGIVTWFRNR
ncbi:hypothetical protein [Streptomyces melanogenes]|uniref:hypothetical protein n=1 Tax=Streptomyces melanogenes TaxID=67326 RepID=UPI00379B5108